MEVAVQNSVGIGNKATKLGVIPEDWDIKPLGELCDVRDGTHESPKYQSEGIPLITSKNLIGNSIDFTEVNCISKSDYEQIEKRSGVSDGDILFGMIGTIGNPVIVQKTKPFAIKNVALIKFRNSKLNNVYALYFIKSAFTNTQFQNLMGGSTQKFIALGVIRKLLIIQPKEAEQKAIATILSDIDSYITALDKLIQKKTRIKTATMQQLLSGRKRLPGFNDDWSQCTYGDFVFLRTATYSRDKLREDGEARYIHYGDIHTKWNHVLDLNVYQLPAIPNTMVSNYTLLQDGDLIMADASEDYEGVAKSVEIQNSDELKIISGLHTYAMRDAKKLFAPGFKGYIHSISSVREQIKKKTVGMKVFGVSKNNLRDIAIPLPSKDEQSAIVSVLSDMQKEITTLQDKRNKLAEMKVGAMHELLTGNIRLV